MSDLFATSFAQRALLEAVMVGALCGVVGVHVILRRLPFLTMALGHATFPGLVLAELVGLNLALGAGLFGMVVVVVVALLGAHRHIDATSAVGVVLAGAFALGVLLLSAQEGFSRDLAAFLVASVVTVQPADLLTTAVAGILVLALLAAFHKELVLGAFDPTALRALGYPALVLDLLMLVLVAVVVVTAIPAVGTLLAVALMAAPAAAARLWSDRLGPTMALAAILGAASGALGVTASQLWSIATGATITLVAAGLFGASLLVKTGLRAGHRVAGQEVAGSR